MINKILTSISRTTPLILIIGVALALTSCEDDEVYKGPITVDRVILIDVNADVPEREVNFGRLGQLIRLEGKGFDDLKKIYINGLSTYFNVATKTDNIVIARISMETPTVRASESERNTIRLVNDGNELIYDFDIRASAPTISRISNTLPVAGETVTVYGSDLVEISSITLPGGIVVTSGINSDVDGEMCSFTMPDGVTESGAILIEGTNGGVYSPAYFNHQSGLIIDFDGTGVHGSWGDDESMIKKEDLDSVLIGGSNNSKGKYVSHLPSRLTSFPANTNRCSEVWTSGGLDWRASFSSEIPTTTPVSEVGIQFDIFVPEEWEGSGYLKICLINSFNGGEWDGAVYNYVPWIVNGKIEPFETDGWTTVTVPFSEFYAFSEEEEAFTFEDVIATREAAQYKNFGFYFENGNFTKDGVDYLATETDVKVYTDNWRVVSLEQQTYSDF